MKQGKTTKFSPLYGLMAGLLCTSAPALASQGYFVLGYGTQSKGMAGVSMAYPRDSLSIASNPASALAVGERADFDIDYLHPDRSARISGNPYGPDQSYDANGRQSFFIPEFGYIHQLNKDWAVGIAVYGNGGMNTTYKSNPYARFGATGNAGLDLLQLIISPTVAYRLAEGHSIGVSAIIVDQRFKTTGIGLFDGLSESPGYVSDRGTNNALGLGIHIGWLGQITPWLSVGASWQSKAQTQKFDRYKGLFADQGGFDVPSTYAVGIAVKASDDLVIAADVKRIEFGRVGSVGNKFQILLDGKLLGSTDGPGFGCNSTTAVKVGVNYQLSPDWQLRAGYAHISTPFAPDQTFLHILAPDTVAHQFTLGTTWTSKAGLEVSAYGRYAPGRTIHGEGSIPASFGGGEVDLHMGHIAFGLGVGKRF